MTPAMVDKLHTGMSESQVKAIMGPPVLINILNNGHIDYVYSSQLGSGDRQEKRVVLVFHHGRLQSIQRAGI
ncbi:MAG TPA: outer membrane protein assembly factor BamE [Gammaproteobacteria bacterium]|nr:outer membrane protein assembly factor BamE [Gammaproteobacteria bacterium]